jgi:hypothetical protein
MKSDVLLELLLNYFGAKIEETSLDDKEISMTDTELEADSQIFQNLDGVNKAKEFIENLIKIFEEKILTTFKSTYIQFIIIFAFSCKHLAVFREKFLSLLILKAFDRELDENIRIYCLNYIASLMGSAKKIIEDQLFFEGLEFILKFSKKFKSKSIFPEETKTAKTQDSPLQEESKITKQTQETLISQKNFGKNKLFSAILQTIAYIFCFQFGTIKRNTQIFKKIGSYLFKTHKSFLIFLHPSILKELILVLEKDTEYSCKTSDTTNTTPNTTKSEDKIDKLAKIHKMEDIILLPQSAPILCSSTSSMLPPLEEHEYSYHTNLKRIKSLKQILSMQKQEGSFIKGIKSYYPFAHCYNLPLSRHLFEDAVSIYTHRQVSEQIQDKLNQFSP